MKSIQSYHPLHGLAHLPPFSSSPGCWETYQLRTTWRRWPWGTKWGGGKGGHPGGGGTGGPQGGGAWAPGGPQVGPVAGQPIGLPYPNSSWDWEAAARLGGGSWSGCFRSSSLSSGVGLSICKSTVIMKVLTSDIIRYVEGTKKKWQWSIWP